MTEPIGAGLSAAKWLLSLRLGYWTKRHNRLAAREYEDRSRWTQDETQAQESALAALAVEMNESNLFYGGAHANRQREIREGFARRWRDRKSSGDRLIEDLRDEENFLHRGWRLIVRRPWPENLHKQAIEHLTGAWETTLEERNAQLLDRIRRELAAAAPIPAGWTKEAIADAIAELPEREKLVVTLSYYEELTLREIGDVLGVSEAHVSLALSRAMTHLRESLEGRPEAG